MDDAAKQALHDALDSLIESRTDLEEQLGVNVLLGTNVLNASSVSPAAQICASRLFERVVRLASEAIGPQVKKLAIDGEHTQEGAQRPILRRWLLMSSPLLYSPSTMMTALAGKKDLTVFDVLDAVSALDAGEVRPIFEPKTGRNRRKNHWSLSRAKLDALVWKRRLKALGHGEKDANYQITIAFGEQWDTIRRWQSQCERILGQAYVTAALSYIGGQEDPYFVKPRGIFAAVTKPDPMQGLRSAGEQYKLQKRLAAELSPRKGRARDE